MHTTKFMVGYRGFKRLGSRAARWRDRTVHALCTLLFSTACVAAQQPEPVLSVATPLVERYFKTNDSKERSRLIAQLVDAGITVETVFDSLRDLRLWDDLPPLGSWSIQLPTGNSVLCSYRVPNGYRPDKSVPLIVAFGAADDHYEQIMISSPDSSPRIFSALARVVVKGGLVQSPDSMSDLARHWPTLIREIRRRIHIDSDRVYVAGDGIGGVIAWHVAIAHPSDVAGVLTIDAFPDFPYPRQSYTLLLPNLRDVAIRAMWRSPTSRANDGGEGFASAETIASINRAIIDYAAKTALPIDGGEIPDGSDAWSVLLDDGATRVLNHLRSPETARVAHWFRFPEQGHSGWIVATQIAGDIWDEDQLSIIPPTGDRDQFITETVADRLFFVGGAIDGQTVTIEARRCAGVEVRFSAKQLDFTRPIKIMCNGRKRFEGSIKPDVATLLETAFETRDFHRPVVARKAFTIRAD